MIGEVDRANHVGAGGNVHPLANLGSPPRQRENHSCLCSVEIPLMPQTYNVSTEARKAARRRIEPCIMLPEGRPSSHLRCNPTQEQERGGFKWDMRRGGNTCGSFMDATARPKARPREGCWMNFV